MQTIEEAMPPHTWETVGPTVNDIIHIKRGGLLSFSLLGILIFTTNGINGLIANFRTSYNKITMRSYLSQYLISLSLVLLLLLILITTLALIVASRLLMEYLEANGGLAFDTIDVGAIVKYGLIGFSLLVCVSLIFHFGPRQIGLSLFSRRFLPFTSTISRSTTNCTVRSGRYSSLCSGCSSSPFSCW